jgi:hypothetical protein
MAGNQLSSTERVKQASASGDVTWGEERRIVVNSSTYACIPPWIANNIGLDSKGEAFEPGYTQEGVPVVVEEEAIIIRPVDGDGDE